MSTERDARLAVRWSIDGNPNFSTDGNAMLMLLDKLYEQCYMTSFQTLFDRTKRVCIEDNNDGTKYTAESKSLPEAVAAAADMIPEGK